MSRPSARSGRPAAIPRTLLLAGLALTVSPCALQAQAPVAASDQPAATAAATTEPNLQQQIERLRQQLLVLARKAELAAEVEVERAKAAATVTASARDGFSLRANDGNFTLRLRGYVQVDGRVYSDDPAERDTFTLRRVRPIFEGTLNQRFGFRLMPDFGGGQTVLQDASVDWTFSPAVVLRAGKMKAPFGLERLQSGTDIAFVERAFPTALAPNRDLGVQLGGQLADGRLEYAIGVFDGVADGASADADSNDEKDLVARLWATPWRATLSPLSGLSFGVAASRGDQQGTFAASGLAGYRTPGQLTFFAYRNDGTAVGTVIADGERLRISPQAVYYNGPLGLIAEYVTSRHQVRRGAVVRELEHEAWQGTAIWVLTGESAAFRWHAPARGFDRAASDATKRGWGAVALTARYHTFAADPASFPELVANNSAQEANAWAVGLDWTLQRQTRLLVDYEVITFDGLRTGNPRPDEKILFTRLQIGW